MHTGTVRGNPSLTGPQLIADGDVAIGMIVQHIMKSAAYYDPGTDTGSALIFT